MTLKLIHNPHLTAARVVIIDGQFMWHLTKAPGTSLVNKRHMKLHDKNQTHKGSTYNVFVVNFLGALSKLLN